MRQLGIALIALVGVFTAASTAPARAADLDLPVPKGYCPMSEHGFKELMTVGGNDFAANNFDLNQLATFVDCRKCEAWPSGRRCSPGYGLYLENPSAAFLTSLPRPEFLERIERTFGLSQPPRASATAASLIPGAEPVSLGVLHRDDVAAYVGYVHRDSRNPQPWVSLTGYTVVRGRLILLKLGAPYTDETTIQDLLTLQTENLQRVVEINSVSKQQISEID